MVKLISISNDKIICYIIRAEIITRVNIAALYTFKAGIKFPCFLLKKNG